MQTGIVIFEDNATLRESLSQLIFCSKEYLLLGCFPNALRVMEQVGELEPDVVLMDIDMPGGVNGIDALIKIKQCKPDTPVIMLTVFDDNKYVLDAISLGASGYILKKHLADKLPDAIGEVLNGGAPMSPNVARMVVTAMQQKASALQDPFGLTVTEKKVVFALSLGNSYKIIAEENFISIDTVRTHIKNIYKKLQVHSQLEAVWKARNAGLL